MSYKALLSIAAIEQNSLHKHFSISKAFQKRARRNQNVTVHERPNAKGKGISDEKGRKGKWAAKLSQKQKNR